MGRIFRKWTLWRKLSRLAGEGARSEGDGRARYALEARGSFQRFRRVPARDGRSVDQSSLCRYRRALAWGACAKKRSRKRSSVMSDSLWLTMYRDKPASPRAERRASGRPCDDKVPASRNRKRRAWQPGRATPGSPSTGPKGQEGEPPPGLFVSLNSMVADTCPFPQPINGTTEQ